MIYKAPDLEVKLREGKPFFIYALVCPLTLDVKYVGQTVDLQKRIRAHTASQPVFQRDSESRDWLRSLGYLRPYRVILERGINRRVTIKGTAKAMYFKTGRRPTGLKTVWLSSVMEAKWMKRFRRTILNTARIGDLTAHLTNPPLPWEEGS